MLEADDASSVIQFKSEGDEHLTGGILVPKSTSIYLQVAQIKELLLLSTTRQANWES